MSTPARQGGFALNLFHCRLAAQLLLVALSLAAADVAGQEPAPPRAGPPPPAAASADAAESSISYADPVAVMRRGGPLMWAILLTSVAMVTFGLERFISLRYSRVIPANFVRRLRTGIENGTLDRHRAVELCRQDGSPIAALFAAALRFWGRPLRELEAAVQEAGQREVALLRRNLRALNGTGNVSTLMGLLGTVLGMIDAFNAVAVQKGLGRSDTLANGIAIALLTTAFGLTVAIPSSLLYLYFAGRVDRLVYEMDCLAAELCDLICAENLNAGPAGYLPIYAAGNGTGINSGVGPGAAAPGYGLAPPGMHAAPGMGASAGPTMTAMPMGAAPSAVGAKPMHPMGAPSTGLHGPATQPTRPGFPGATV